MKKMIFCLLAAVALVGCEDKTAYTITGTVTGVEEGTEVTLSADRRGKDVLETTTVQDGKFEFKGNQVEAVVKYLKVEGQAMLKRPQLIVAEAGKIAVVADEDKLTVSGTPLNDKHTKFWTDVANKKEDSFDYAIFRAFIKENITNVLGVALFEANAYTYNFDELKETYALVPEQFRSLPTMVKVKSNIDVLEATAVGKKFTDIKGLTPDGKELALSDYVGKGKYVLVDFWASWCPPCVADMPHLVAAYAKYKDKGFEIVGVSIDDKQDAWKGGIEKLNITWPQVSDLKGWESQLSKTYGVMSIPHTILIDKDGTIVEKQIHGKDLDAKLAELLK